MTDSPARPQSQGVDLGSIYQAEVNYVWESLQRLGIRPGDLEDVVHDVFVTVHRRLVDFDRTRPIRPWLFGICLRTASDYRRSARIRREVGPDSSPEPADRGPHADEQLASNDARRAVLDALDSLPLEQRAVFVLHELDAIAMPAIAAELEVPLNTLYSRLRLARRQFAVAIRRRHTTTPSELVRAGGQR